MKMPAFVLVAAVAVALAAASLVSAATFGPTPYLSASDSPIVGVISSYFYLEDFEDGALNTPGVSVTAGAVVTAAGGTTDSVDGDDGVIDGLGQGGRSLFTNAALTTMEFQFNAGVLGSLPTHAGIVWTDVGFALTGASFVGDVTAEAFDSANLSVGVIGPVNLGGDGTVNGATAEDRFLGFSNAGGIARLVISMPNSADWEVDHLQYGRAVPEPATIGGAFVAAAGALRRRRRR